MASTTTDNRPGTGRGSSLPRGGNNNDGSSNHSSSSASDRNDNSSDAKSYSDDDDQSQSQRLSNRRHHLSRTSSARNVAHAQCEVRLRRGNACNAMSGRERMRVGLRKTMFGWTRPNGVDHREDDFGGSCHHADDADGDGGSSIGIDEEHGQSSGGGGVRQYNLTAKSVQSGSASRWGWWRHPIRTIVRCIYLMCCCGSDSSDFDPTMTTSTSSSTTSTGDSGRLISRFVNFLFRSSFIFVTLIAAAAFYALVCVFAGFLVGAATLEPTCISIGGEPGFPGGDGTHFADAFELSWTTFSTVGYGSYSPSVAQDSDSRTHCAFVTVICCIESFIGVLYGGFVGAIMFSKITRIQCLAQVEFSHPMVVRYGCGVAAWETEVDDEDQDEDDNDDEKKLAMSRRKRDGSGDDEPSISSKKELSAKEIKAATLLQAAFRGASVRGGGASIQRIPCPVLEFRIANRLHYEAGGEIMDAVLTVVANQDADEADPVLRNKLDEARRNWEKTTTALRRRAGLMVSSVKTGDDSSTSPGSLDGRGTVSDSIRTNASTGSSVLAGSKTVQFASTVTSGVMSSAATVKSNVKQNLTKSALQTVVGNLGKKDHQAVDEDPTAQLVSKRIFSKLLIEASEHPYFRRLWLARHILDETSPLLSPRARRLVKRNGGYWPASLNSYESIKNNIQFNQILVSLVGISNISGSEVYAQKVYERVDCVVGYQFVNVLYRGGDNSLKVDLDLLNDVREQNGGGGEPLTDL
mmetsp:Transcript_36512/g.79495  ORF Transcript_36512/g.79495 Transcript_36512/m.79495 type:complete len:749 (-) Transcript_36512:44-2290(-)